MRSTTHRTLRAEGVDFRHVFIWSDQDERVAVTECANTSVTIRLGDFGQSLVSTGFAYIEPPWVAKTVEELQTENLVRIASAHGLVVYVTNDEARVERLASRFDEAGGRVSSRVLRVVDDGGLRIPLYLMRIEPQEPQS